MQVDSNAWAENPLTPSQLRQMVELSREFVHRAFNGDVEWCRGHVAPDLLFVSAEDLKRPMDLSSLEATLRSVREERIRVVLASETLNVVSHDPSSCSVLCTASAFLGSRAHPASFYSRQIRITMHWSSVDVDEPILTCYHCSFPQPRIVEEFLGTEDASTQPPLPVPLGMVGRVHVIRDPRGVIHYVDEADILYVHAKGRNCDIVCRDRTVTATRGISALEKDLGRYFIRLHRSYLVNVWYLTSISYREATLADGTRLPVPSPKFDSLKDRIAELRSTVASGDGS